MWRFVNKHEFFEALHGGLCDEDAAHLKFIQDAWFHLYFSRHAGLTRVLEIGGGSSRILPKLHKKGVEVWNADRLQGEAAGPVASKDFLKSQSKLGIKLVMAYVGEFSPELPDKHFDLAFSISVLEHLDEARTRDCFRDARRVLRPGGIMLHAVDLFLNDKPLPRTTEKIAILKKAIDENGFMPAGADDIGAAPVFKTHYASSADFYLGRNWCFNPALQSLVEQNQLVTLVMAHRAPEAA